MRTLFIAGFLLAISATAVACDVCGCSVGGNYFGILPGFHQHFIGLRWSSERSYTALSADALRAGRFHSEEQFRAVEVLARFYPAHRWQTLLMAPWRFYSQAENSVISKAQGLGDVSLLGSYVLLDTGDSLRGQWRQTLNLGGGLKLPTGRSRLAAADGGALHPNLQPGSGSTDFLFLAAYTLRRGPWGASADVLGRINTRNHQQYQFGNRLSGSVKCFYWTQLRRLTLLPNAGIFADAAGANRDTGKRIDGSEGVSGFATFGLDVYAGHLSAGLNYQPPCWQSRRTVQAGARWMFTFNYII